MLAAFFHIRNYTRILIAKQQIVFYIVGGFWIRAWNV